ncbi:MAG: S8 family peptidase [Campylobacterales bacterium]
MNIKTLSYLLSVLIFLTSCGGGGGSSTTTSSSTTESTPSSDTTSGSGGGGSSNTVLTLSEQYGSQIEPANITVGGNTLSGFTLSMSEYTSASVSLNAIGRSPRQYAFVIYKSPEANGKPKEKTSTVGIASLLPKYTDKYKNYAINASDDDGYGLSSSDYLVLITISGGVFSDGTALKGKLYTIIPKSYLERGDKPKINELGTYAVMRVLRSGASTKEDVLETLETIAKSYFSSDPETHAEANFNSFNNFNPTDKDSLRDEDAYNTLVNQTKQAIIEGDTVALNSVFENDKDGDGVIVAEGECTEDNYQDEGYKGRDCFDNRAEIYKYMLSDKDGDFIPDDVEDYLGMDNTNWDENDNGVADGIDTAFDKFYKNQWHLRSTGIVTNNINNVKTIIGNDLDMLEVQRSYMGYNDGNYIGVQIVDSGIEADHEDLQPNMDLNLSINAVNGSNDPTPTEEVDESSEKTEPLSIGHGSACAGIVAARGFNDKGVRGITPLAKISGSNWLEEATDDNLDIWLIDDSNSTEIVVSNNSWGNTSGNSQYQEIFTVSELLEKGAKLRDEKGRVYVFAAGNSRDTVINGDVIMADANLDATASHRYSVTVAALDYNNSYAPYSNPGANLWLSGYAGSSYTQTPTIATTLLTGKSKRLSVDDIGKYSAPTFYNDDSKSYTFAMNGTSAAAPTVSGAIALILEACPELTQRDVKYLSAITAKKVDPQNSSWITNSAGLKHSRDYGFGLINPKVVIDKCKNGYTLLSEEDNASVAREGTEVIIPPNSSVVEEFSIGKNLKTEYIYIWHDIDTIVAGSESLDMELTSPSGTTMPIIKNLVEPYIDFRDSMRFGVAGFLDESSHGVWKLSIKNTSQSEQISFRNIGFEIFGR